MRFVFLILAVLVFHASTLAQKPDDDPDEITSNDFERTRDIGSGITGGDEVFKFRVKKRIPRAKQLAARPKPPVKPGPKKVYDLPSDDKSPEAWEKIGVTLWRLTADTKPATKEKETARLLVQETGKEYTPQRVAADTVFNKGDEVRLSIESPRKGYLYVIDREIRADGSVGVPYQIFPTRLARGGNNRIESGQMIDIPSQSDAVPFYTLKSNDPNWRGELLTIIVSPTELPDLGVPAKQVPISAALVADMEAKYLKDTTEYEQQGSAGKNYTKAEKEAGSTGTRQLTQGDPFPQTVYRTRVRAKEPMMINLSVSVNR